jgi:hypothetical protein
MLCVDRLPICCVPGGTQWQSCKAEIASLRLLRNGMAWRSAGLPASPSFIAAADGNTITTRESNLHRTCATLRWPRRDGPSSRTSNRHRCRPWTIGVPLRDCTICRCDRGGSDFRGRIRGDRPGPQAWRGIARPQLRVLSCNRSKRREYSQVRTSVSHTRPALPDRVLGRSAGRGHHVRPP